MEDIKYLILEAEKLKKEIFKDIPNDEGGPKISKVIPLLIFNKILDNIQSIIVLYENNEKNTGDTVLSISRAILENYWGLLFILETDSEFRALAYYYYSRLEDAENNLKQYDFFKTQYNEKKSDYLTSIELCKNDLNLLEIARNRCINNKAFVTNTTILIKNNDEFSDKAKSIIEYDTSRIEEYNGLINEKEKQINDILHKIKKIEESIVKIDEEILFYQQRLDYLNNDDKFNDIRDEIINVKNVKYVKWYSLKTNYGSLYKLASHLSLNDEYDTTYAMLSLETHSLNATKGIVETIEGYRLRTEEDVVHTKELAASIGFGYLSKIIKQLLKFYDKEDQFKKLQTEMVEFYK
ncbi:hypothetical protein C7Y47_24150 [Lysinibacillus sphaericus]|uniref:Uncharacterized protein n=1 Tax=Lysinibacillus sphaericus TaxID=1421 RepID=A0A544U7A2_LYSSH|nr:DUF5677 domain-containing protein [Lysinibacillus sp. SDF0037]TQR26829.1 hypothetical protein C7Y47_24150 [Lysinibacillus sp. SDF0037]